MMSFFGIWAGARATMTTTTTTTLHRLHQIAQRNIVRAHRQLKHNNNPPSSRRYESSKSSGSSSSSNSTTGGGGGGGGGGSTTTSAAAARNASTLATTSNATMRIKERLYTYLHRLPRPPRSVTSRLAAPFHAYSAMQTRRPLLTQWETTIVIYFLGDLSAQTVQTAGFSEEDTGYSPLRSLRAMLIGALLSIPSYKSFLWLGRNFNHPTSHLISLARKIVISQCLFTPVFSGYFFGMQCLLSGGNLAQAWERIATTVPVSWVNSWKVWPLVTAVNFTFVAPRNRSVFAGCVAIFWQTYLSWLNRKAELAERGGMSEEEERKSMELAGVVTAVA